MDSRTFTILERITLTAIGGFVLGIVLASYLHIPYSYLVAILITSFCLLIFNRKAFFISLFCITIVFGVVRFDISRPDVHLSTGEEIQLFGYIGEPSVRESSQQFILKQDGFNVLASTEKESKLFYRDYVSVVGTLEKPENFMTDQGREFDYISYLYKDNIVYRISFAEVEVVEESKSVLGVLFKFKNALLRQFRSLVSDTEGELLSGIVLGVRQSLPNDFRNDLITTGTIHIVALSGHNISVVARLLGSFTTPFLSGVGIILFVLMTGAQSSAIRAGIMGLIALLALKKEGTYDAFRALILAFVVMLLWNPKLLIFDVSFQLSLLATLGILFITPKCMKWFSSLPEKVLWIIPFRETIAVTLSAQIAVLPVLLYKMGTLSFISLPANILVLPVIPPAMAMGTLAGFIGFLSPLLAQPFAYITQVLLSYVSFLVGVLAKLPHASVSVSLSLFSAVLMYVAILFLLYKS